MDTTGKQQGKHMYTIGAKCMYVAAKTVKQAKLLLIYSMLAN